MAKRDVRTMRFPVTPDKLLEVLISHDYQEARELELGALEARIEERERTDEKLVVEVVSKQYARGVTGVDKSKTENVSTTYTWDLKAKKADWVHHSSHGKIVKVHGSLQVEPDGDNSKLLSEFNIEVKVPLVGRKVESMILNEVSEGWDYYERTILKFCQKTE
jgi:hypothetical protein